MDNEMLKLLSDLLDKKLQPLKEGQERLEKKLDAVVDQTADLTEFRTQVIDALEDLKTVEEATKQNCYDIAKLKFKN